MTFLLLFQIFCFDFFIIQPLKNIMSTQSQSNDEANQPEIQTQPLNPSSQSTNQHQNKQKPQIHEQTNHEQPNEMDELTRTQLVMKNIRTKHPECIPVFYVKHQASPKQFPSPKVPFILFKKDLPIEQAMYNLYNQIQIKGLYFFCTRYDLKDKKMKYVILKPGQTIEQIYKKYGKNDHLTLIYGDKNIGMGGVNKLQKWLIRIMFFLLAVWLFIIGYPLCIAYEQGGVTAVWDTLSLIWTRPNHIDENKTNQEQNNQSLITNDSPLGEVKDFNQEDFIDSGQKPEQGKQEMWISKSEENAEMIKTQF